METEFAPADRASAEAVQAAAREVANNPVVNALLSAVDIVPLLLNQQRQVIAFNGEALSHLGADAARDIQGMRPGEVFSCSSRKIGPSGCGTSRDCRVCGIVNAILESQKSNRPAERESLVRVERDGFETTLEMRVRAAPLRIRDQTFTFVYLQDISDRKRREILERVFLHDLRNTISGLIGWTSHLQDTREDPDPDVVGRILAVAERLDREVREQYDLLRVESGALKPEVAEVTPGEVLDELKQFFSRNLYTEERAMLLKEPVPDVTLHTDSVLLVRVLTNMLKNAFEATPRGGRVTLWSQADGKACSFHVHNPGVIPEETAAQIFRRSFSTKAESGRGLGTYSMKLFGERILGGKVSFRSNEEEGTIFWISLPVTGSPRQED